MNHTNRRKFIKSFSAGVTASMFTPVFAATDLDKQRTSLLELSKFDYKDLDENFWEQVAEQFIFQPNLHYFNNASLGPSPIVVQEATRKFRDTLDAFPSKYMWGAWKDDVEKVRSKVASLFSVSNEEIALIHNTTEGMNLIARSFDLQKDDEIIVANHEHPSGTIPWEVWQETKGIKIVRPELPILPDNTDEVVAVYKNAITSRTKIISICHIVNTNGMMLPIKEISKMAHDKGILVAVDGAQSAGMLSIDLHDLGCDFYAASSHKWLFSPKGVGVLYAKYESQKFLKPLMVARGHNDKSIRRLENYNTRNYPEVLGLGTAIDFYNKIGKQNIDERSKELKSYFRSQIQNDSRFKIKTPASNDLSGAIQVVEVIGKDAKEIKKKLIEQFGIDCRPMTDFNLNALRFSFAIYITKKDIDYLVKALTTIASL
ncbi:aminotransferase class V-fold PLP-dependent enzyme [Aquimarina sp. AU474]|uniref:aminotransferase class V-fold PLP-dependent enzyme n=1 Tax=Aquimarina sp. AU474 TaxID=2108529 RepID=UPI000D69571F|nr:aminotransferase class V-fold PLP-dependent enzyme [Aquimarina sp. AU474]